MLVCSMYSKDPQGHAGNRRHASTVHGHCLTGLSIVTCKGDARTLLHCTYVSAHAHTVHCPCLARALVVWAFHLSHSSDALHSLPTERCCHCIAGFGTLSGLRCATGLHCTTADLGGSLLLCLQACTLALHWLRFRHLLLCCA